jgi:hypothetical protein
VSIDPRQLLARLTTSSVENDTETSELSEFDRNSARKLLDEMIYARGEFFLS